MDQCLILQSHACCSCHSYSDAIGILLVVTRSCQFVMVSLFVFYPLCVCRLSFVFCSVMFRDGKFVLLPVCFVIFSFVCDVL